MKTVFSTSWIKSKQPRKQRKYRANAPLHIQGKFLSAHLSNELRKKHGTRSARLKKGDKVKVLRGKFKGHEGNVERINTKHEKVYVSKVEVSKREGSKVQPPLKASNLLILQLNTDDKRRMEKLGKYTQAKPATPKKEVKEEVKKETKKETKSEEKKK